MATEGLSVDNFWGRLLSILDNSMLSLVFGSLGVLDFQCFKVSYFAFSPNLSNSG